MSDFKLCDNGHYYPVNMDKCPYCPENRENAVSKQNFEKTKIIRREQTISHQPQDHIENKPTSEDIQTGDKVDPGMDLTRTRIHVAQEKELEAESIQAGRKLVGWLVSFSIDPVGVDFKLFEGRTIVGADVACDIVVQDSKVSAKHLTILFRLGKFKFKDELSTNGTFINEEFVEEGELQDGDNIRIGDTTFKFKSVF